ncbi:MAG TPA: hypothetical protein VM717_04500 [Chthoniobacterales bacterium]|nr:hypothetical protein [Chthoniobacterales bacterium]
MVEIVSVGADETTDVSVVGKFPTAFSFALTLGAEAVGGVVDVDETTDASSVGNRIEAALGDGVAEGDGDVDATEGVLPISAAEPFC